MDRLPPEGFPPPPTLALPERWANAASRYVRTCVSACAQRKSRLPPAEILPPGTCDWPRPQGACSRGRKFAGLKEDGGSGGGAKGILFSIGWARAEASLRLAGKQSPLWARPSGRGRRRDRGSRAEPAAARRLDVHAAGVRWPGFCVSGAGLPGRPAAGAARAGCPGRAGRGAAGVGAAAGPGPALTGRGARLGLCLCRPE